MAELAFELRYGAVSLASEVNLSAVGPGSAFVPLDHPLPVGCALELHAGEAVLTATVSRVVEAVKGRDDRPGVWIRLGELGAEAAALWEPLVEGEDPVFPEPVGAVAAEADVGTDGDGVRKGDSSQEPVDDGRKTEIMEAVSVDGVIEDGVVQAVGEDEDEDKTRPISEIEAQPPKPRGKKKRRKRRKTR